MVRCAYHSYQNRLVALDDNGSSRFSLLPKSSRSTSVALDDNRLIDMRSIHIQLYIV